MQVIRILNTDKKDISPRYDKGGAFHYENYISELYFYLLSHNQKEKKKKQKKKKK